MQSVACLIVTAWSTWEFKIPKTPVINPEGGKNTHLLLCVLLMLYRPDILTGHNGMFVYQQRCRTTLKVTGFSYSKKLRQYAFRKCDGKFTAFDATIWVIDSVAEWGSRTDR